MMLRMVTSTSGVGENWPLLSMWLYVSPFICITESVLHPNQVVQNLSLCHFINLGGQLNIIGRQMSATSPDITRHHPTTSDTQKIQYGLHTSPLLVKIFQQFQRTGLCLPARSFQRTRQQYHATTLDTRKIQYGGEKYESKQFLASILDFLVQDVVIRCGAHFHWNGNAFELAYVQPY